MYNLFVYIVITILSTLFMEIIAILSHKYIMHGPGWFLHKSHHHYHHKKFELNDIYFLIFSMPSIFCIIRGMLINNKILLSIGVGILIYGLIYIFFHDIIVHRRFGLKIGLDNYYIRNIKKSHLKHHKNKSRKGATNFGFITY